MSLRVDCLNETRFDPPIYPPMTRTLRCDGKHDERSTTHQAGAGREEPQSSVVVWVTWIAPARIRTEEQS